MKRFLPLFLVLAAIFGPLIFAPSCANTTEAPSGGKKDTIPPYIIDIKPLPGACNVARDIKLIFSFNEYVVIKNQGNIFLSPPQQKPVKARLSGKNLIVSFEEPLDTNTTYTLDFTDAIADNNEGNMFPGFTYVFSTGPKIDSMMITGTVQDCNTLNPVKGATVLLYKDHADSAVFLRRPYAATKTDQWGFFTLPFIEDTLYRLYAIKDANNSNIYDPDSETIGFVDSLIRPVLVANDTVKEMLKYDMEDTLACLSRISEYEIRLFREKPSKQLIVRSKRTDFRSGYISFMAPGAMIDSLWFKGYRANRLISQFNILHDSLELWLNDRGPVPDTLKLMVNYHKTDSTGKLAPTLEQINLILDAAKRPKRGVRQKITHDDTTCIFKLLVDPSTVEQDGFVLEFQLPIIYERFDSLQFSYLNPRQREFKAEYSVERDSLNLRRYTIRPKDKLLPGHEYSLKVPARSFKDISGYWCDSVKVKVSLPSDDRLGSLTCDMQAVDRKVIVELLDERCVKVLRRFIIDKDCTLDFKYLKAGQYCLRLTEDVNRNSFVDTGSVLEKRQPEKVVFYKYGGNKFIRILESAELSQSINVGELFN